jgi:predicted nucleic acid-binding protein
MVSVIDTNVLLGKANDRDDWHEDATQLIGTIDAGDPEPVHVTDYIIVETMLRPHEGSSETRSFAGPVCFR